MSYTLRTPAGHATTTLKNGQTYATDPNGVIVVPDEETAAALQEDGYELLSDGSGGAASPTAQEAQFDQAFGPAPAAPAGVPQSDPGDEAAAPRVLAPDQAPPPETPQPGPQTQEEPAAPDEDAGAEPAPFQAEEPASSAATEPDEG